MKKLTVKQIVKGFFLIGVLGVSISAISCAATKKAQQKSVWESYFVGNIHFEDKAPGTKGSDIYHRIITEPEKYIAEKARIVLNTLYFSPEDSIVPVHDIHYTIEDIKGVSAKGGNNGDIAIWYSTQHIERTFAQKDTAKLDYETAGVLMHELTHAYQLEPQGIGDYGSNKVFWAFIEGMADAVRVENGYFQPENRPKGGSYMDGYRAAGFFFVWIKNTKDKEFLRKFNRSTLEVVPWSFDGAIKHVLGDEYNIDDLWKEYQIAMGDTQA